MGSRRTNVQLASTTGRSPIRRGIKILLTALAAVVYPAAACHAQSSSRAPKNAVVRLSSEQGGCGSGFFIDRGAALVTNTHVTELLCTGTTCPSVRVEYALGGARFAPALPAETVALQVRRRLPSIDLAILDLPPDLRSPFSLKFSETPAAPMTEISMLGYPRCMALGESRGIISDMTSTSFLTGAAGASGSSGGPVLNADGDVVGIVFQSDSLLRSIYDALGKGSYPLRAVRADLLQTLLSAPDSSLRGAEARLLLDFYTKDVALFGGLTRLKRGLQFLNAARMLASTILVEPGSSDLVRAAALMDHAPEALMQRTAPAPETPDGKEMELLSFVTNLESRGLMSGAARRITPELLSAALRAQGHTAGDVTRFLSFLPRPDAKNPPGIIPLLAFIGAIVAAFGAVLILAWASSLGYVYARGRGGRWRRFARTVAVAVVFWPISLIWFRLSTTRAVGAEPTSKKSARVAQTSK